MVEVFLLKKMINKESWDALIKKITKYEGIEKTWHIYVVYNNSFIKFYLKTNKHIPASLEKIDNFLFKKCDALELDIKKRKKSILLSCETLNNIKEELEIREKGHINYIDIKIKSSIFGKINYKINIITEKKNYLLLMNNPGNMLTIDFNLCPNILPTGTPKYLDISKNISLLTSNKESSLFEIDAFPFLEGHFYLDQDSYDFNKHSLVVGSSGSGKSKFLASFVKNILTKSSKYKIVVIDPHASLENDIGGLGCVIDFLSNSVNLFASDTDIIINIELMLELITSLIGSNNTKVERVLRHSLYILLTDKSFNFINLKKVILDTFYRNDLLNKYKDTIPINIIEFFASEFNEIKTKSYMDAISPIISLVDELSLIPVFNSNVGGSTLLDSIKSNDLLLFSLDRTKLGDKVTKTLSGLVMEQLLTLVQKREIDEHVIFIIDEISVVENPIMSIFLSEARKYNLSLILSGQYFNQVSEDLKNSIFANVLNYYIFRVSRGDATLLNKNINIKIPMSDEEETKIKLLTELKNRECIIRISKNGTLLPPLKGITNDFFSIPRKNNLEKDNTESNKKTPEQNTKSTKFKIDTNITLKDILMASSTSRKDLKNER